MLDLYVLAFAIMSYTESCSQVFDLSQRSPAYFRTELKDGCLMGLKTNTKLYSSKKRRVMTVEEIASSLVLPCTASLAA